MRVTGTDDDRAEPSAGRAAVGFALAVLVASTLPVSWAARAVDAVGRVVGAVGGGDAVGRGDPLGGGGGTLPVDIGLTDPFHLVGYAVLTVLASRAIGRGRRGLPLAAGAAVAFGFGIELVQAPIPWRSFAWGDAAVNAVGAGLGAAAVVAAAALREIAGEPR
ncbi:hypothetical protein ACFQMF_08195 [Halorubrum rutilum]|uniref:VanZ like family protein n=1 Tax=Halorubrum rutilum TaxID=1364933 RepID=A0ABD6AKL2_9EURY|nr:hypothetical protein [Halorubrum rutilum]